MTNNPNAIIMKKNMLHVKYSHQKKRGKITILMEKDRNKNFGVSVCMCEVLKRKMVNRCEILCQLARRNLS